MGKTTIGNFKNQKSFQSFKNLLTFNLLLQIDNDINYIIFVTCKQLKRIKKGF